MRSKFCTYENSLKRSKICSEKKAEACFLYQRFITLLDIPLFILSLSVEDLVLMFLGRNMFLDQNVVKSSHDAIDLFNFKATRLTYFIELIICK